MADRKDLAPVPTHRDPVTLLRQLTSELDRLFEEPFWAGLRWPALGATCVPDTTWGAEDRCVRKGGSPHHACRSAGHRKEDIAVEVKNGRLVLTGERKSEREEKKENVYRTEREYGTFYRAIPRQRV